MTSTMRWQVLARAATGAGNSALSSDPARRRFRQVEHALIVWHIRIEQRLQRVADRRLRRVERDVDVAGHLLRRSGEVETDAPSRATSMRTRIGISRVAHAVIVHQILENVKSPPGCVAIAARMRSASAQRFRRTPRA